MPRNPNMHTFQVFDDVPAIECRDGSLMSDHFAPTTNYDEYSGRWRSLDPTLWSHQSIEDPGDAPTAHLMSLKRHISDLTNSANGHGSFSRAEVAAFPGAFSEYGTKFFSASNPGTDALGVSPQPGAGICQEENDSGIDRSPASLILVLSAGFPSGSFLTLHSGRAPPSEVRYC